MDNFSIADLASPDLARMPALGRARGMEGVLEPGDVLWLPRFHWHYVRQLGDARENLSLNFWCEDIYIYVCIYIYTYIYI